MSGCRRRCRRCCIPVLPHQLSGTAGARDAEPRRKAVAGPRFQGNNATPPEACRDASLVGLLSSHPRNNGNLLRLGTNSRDSRSAVGDCIIVPPLPLSWRPERRLLTVRSTGRCNTLTFEQEVKCYGSTGETSLLYSG